jgi:hypothetical protein
MDRICGGACEGRPAPDLKPSIDFEGVRLHGSGMDVKRPPSMAPDWWEAALTALSSPSILWTVGPTVAVVLLVKVFYGKR